MEPDPGIADALGDPCQRQQRPGLVVAPNQCHQIRRLPQNLLEATLGQHPLGIDADALDAHAPRRQYLEGRLDRGMLDIGGDDARATPRPRPASKQRVVRLAGARRKNQPLARAPTPNPDGLGHAVPRPFDQGVGGRSLGMNTRRIAVNLVENAQHRVAHFGAQRRRRVVIEIDPHRAQRSRPGSI